MRPASVAAAILAILLVWTMMAIAGAGMMALLVGEAVLWAAIVLLSISFVKSEAGAES